jgi:hypothetical protein
MDDYGAASNSNFNAQGSIPSGRAVPILGSEEKGSRKAFESNFNVMQENNELVNDLQTVNKKLEEELEQMKETFSLRDNSDHFNKIQELFNKLQIENKNLRIYNQKCESKLSSK